MDDELQERLRSVGLDPARLTDPRQAWNLLFARYGTRVSISDRYAIEAAVREIDPGQLTAAVKADLSREVLESQFPGIELIGAPSGAPIEVVPYDPGWQSVFTNWRDRLRSAVPAATLIEHVGSTAVPGLAAKPIVDIQLSVPAIDDEDAYGPQMAGLGVALRSRDGRHRYFRPPADQPRVVQIHVCQSASRWERDHLLFRDFLRAHPAVRDSYAELKRRLAIRHRTDRLAYTDAKAGFILDTLAAAADWADNTGWTVPGTE